MPVRVQGIAYIRIGAASTLQGQRNAYNGPMDDSMTILLAIEGIVLFLYGVVALFGIGSSRNPSHRPSHRDLLRYLQG